MSLQVWLPFTDGTLKQQGLSSAIVTSSNYTVNNNGKLGKCIKTKNATGLDLGYDGNQINTGGISFGGWFKFNKDEIGEVINNARTYNSTYNTPTGQLIGNDSYGGIGIVWNSNNMYTSSPFSSLLICSNIRTSTVNRTTGSYTVVFDTWVHVFVTFNKDTGALTLYINGSKFSETVFSSFSDARSYNLMLNYAGVYGGNGPGLYIPFDCNDIRVYDHCLSPMEVKRISQGLACHYNLSDGTAESTYNYLQNKSFSNYGSYGFGSKGTISITTEVEPPIAGNEVALVTNSSTTSGNSAVEIATSIYPGTIMNKDETFTVTAYVKGKGATIGKRAHIHLYNTNGTNTQSTGKDYVFTSEWQRIEYTLKWNYDTPSNSSLNCYVVGYMAPQEQFYVSSIQVEKKDHSTPFTADTRTSTTIYDTSGYCNNGTITGDLTTSTDTPKYQASIYMPTAATISHSRCLDNTSQEWTCAAWVKPDAAGNYQNLNNFNESNRLYHGTYPLLYLNSGTNDYYNYGNLALPANQWSHIVFVFKNSTGTKLIYVNGENRTNTGGPNRTSTPKGIPDTVIIGGSFAGYMCDYREYATALSADDVKSLYQNTATIDADGTIHGAVR